jgi:hydroxymethylpyrimidine pyrophosphatase-like HAD family hydrolase
MDDLNSPRWLLVSDVDDTLTGDEGGLAAFARTCAGVVLVLNSSRPRASVLKTLDSMPPQLRVDGLITALGTELTLAGAATADWPARFESWQRGPIDDLMVRAGAVPHPSEMQTPYKASFAVPRDHWRELEEAVTGLSPDSQVITSGESDFDVIPAAAGKANATRWVAERLGIDPSRLVVAGDSGNDLAMFEAAPRAIAVGNARAELVERVDPERTYFAHRPRAWGLIEGLRHWKAIP